MLFNSLKLIKKCYVKDKDHLFRKFSSVKGWQCINRCYFYVICITWIW